MPAGDLYYFTFVVPDVDQARAFYSGLFGWDYENSGPDSLHIPNTTPYGGLAGGAEVGVPTAVRLWVIWGGGPRAGQALVLGAKARALLDGRSVADLDDVRAVALPVMRHRVLLNFQAEADGMDADQIVARLLEAVPAP